MKTHNASPRVIAFATTSILAGALFSSRAGFIVLDTFGPGDTYNASVGYNISTSGSSSKIQQSVAVSFTPGVSQNLAGLTLATYRLDGIDSITVEVVEDIGGLPNGPVLESFSGLLSAGVQSFSSASNPLLAAGTTYWVTVLPGGSDTCGAWYLNNRALYGSMAFNSALGIWEGPTPDYFPALRVEVVPEMESSACVAALGLLGFGIWRRVRR